LSRRNAAARAAARAGREAGHPARFQGGSTLLRSKARRATTRLLFATLALAAAAPTAPARMDLGTRVAAAAGA
jgi:hypothetical protein